MYDYFYKRQNYIPWQSDVMDIDNYFLLCIHGIYLHNFSFTS